jgi:hypothetical protein
MSEGISPVTQILVERALVALNAVRPAPAWVPDLRFKAIIIASPKTGKTGAIAALVNAGYRVILAAFDPGYTVLLNLIEPDKLHNLIILPFEDRRGFQEGSKTMTVGHLGTPEAFGKFVAFLNDGKARQAACQGGEVIDLGPSENWGKDTFLVVDNLSSVSDTAMGRLLSMVGLDRVRRRRKDWGLSADEVDNVLIQMASSFFQYHLIVLAHWKIQGPREWEDEDKRNPDKTDYTNELREAEKDLIPTKQVPKSIGRILSQDLIRHFDTCVWAEIDDQGRRIFNLEATPARDSGVPVRPGVLPKTLPIETGLLSIFRAVTGAP